MVFVVLSAPGSSLIYSHRPSRPAHKSAFNHLIFDTMQEQQNQIEVLVSFLLLSIKMPGRIFMQDTGDKSLIR